MSAKLKIVISMAVFGTLALFVKNISLPPGEVALFRAMIAAATIILYKALTAEKPHFARIKKRASHTFSVRCCFICHGDLVK